MADERDLELLLPSAARPDPSVPAPGLGEPALDAGVTASSAMKRLAPELRDARLWVVPGALPLPGKADVVRVRERLYAGISEMTDSILMAREARRRALDWTFTDDEGRRWGISPKCIHLGFFALGACGSGGRPEYYREWDANNARAASARIRDLFDKRVEAIRERKNRERAMTNDSSS